MAWCNQEAVDWLPFFRKLATGERRVSRDTHPSVPGSSESSGTADRPGFSTRKQEAAGGAARRRSDIVCRQIVDLVTGAFELLVRSSHEPAHGARAQSGEVCDEDFSSGEGGAQSLRSIFSGHVAQDVENGGHVQVVRPQGPCDDRGSAHRLVTRDRSERQRTSASARPSTVGGLPGARQPFTPSLSHSGIAPVAYATTGTPCRLASCPIRPKWFRPQTGHDQDVGARKQPGNADSTEPTRKANAQIVTGTHLPRYAFPAAPFRSIAGKG